MPTNVALHVKNGCMDSVVLVWAKKGTGKLGCADFRVVFRNYRKRALAIDWRTLNKTLELKLDLPTDDIFPMDLWKADMGKVLKHVFIKPDPAGKMFGFLPKMATTSKGSIGSFLAVSFCERINSAANQVVTKGNSTLAPDEIDMLVTLRTNRRFMNYMREHHPQAAEQHLRMTVVKSTDNAESSDDEEDE